jgi:hypothetical protein
MLRQKEKVLWSSWSRCLADKLSIEGATLSVRNFRCKDGTNIEGAQDAAKNISETAGNSYLGAYSAKVVIFRLMVELL